MAEKDDSKKAVQTDEDKDLLTDTVLSDYDNVDKTLEGKKNTKRKAFKTSSSTSQSVETKTTAKNVELSKKTKLELESSAADESNQGTGHCESGLSTVAISKVQPDPSTGAIPKVKPVSSTGAISKIQSDPSTGAIPKIQPDPSTGAIPKIQPDPSTGSIPKIQPDSSTGAIPKIQPDPSTGAIPKIQPDSSTGAIPKVQNAPAEKLPTPKSDKLKKASEKLHEIPKEWNTSNSGSKKPVDPDCNNGDTDVFVYQPTGEPLPKVSVTKKKIKAIDTTLQSNPNKANVTKQIKEIAEKTKMEILTDDYLRTIKIEVDANLSSTVDGAHIDIKSSQQPSIQETEEQIETKWSHLSEFSKEIVCPNCIKIYNKSTRSPRTFPCGHTLCTLCVKIRKLSKCLVCNKETAPGASIENKSLKVLLYKVLKEVLAIDIMEKANGSPLLKDALSDLREYKGRSKSICIKSLQSIVIDNQVKTNVLNYFEKVYAERVEKMKLLRIDIETLMPQYAAVTTKMMSSESIKDIAVNMNKVADHMLPYSNILARARDMVLTKDLRIEHDALTLLQFGNEIKFEEIEIRHLSHLGIKLVVFLDYKGLYGLYRMFSLISLRNEIVHLNVFNENFPNGVSIFADFYSFDLYSKIRRIYLDLDLKDTERESISPARLYITFINNLSAQHLRRSILGLDGHTFINAIVESTSDYIKIKCCTENSSAIDTDFLIDDMEYYETINIGAVFAHRVNDIILLKISKVNLEPEKDETYRILGYVTGGLTELSKIDYKAVIVNAGAELNCGKVQRIEHN